MSEYLDYDEAVRANRARKKKAMAMKRKRQAQIRLIKRNLFAAILPVSYTHLTLPTNSLV